MDRIFEAFIPRSSDRIQVTPSNCLHAFFTPWLPVFLASYLSRRRDGQLLRLALMAATPFICLRVSFGYEFVQWEYRYMNWLDGTRNCRHVFTYAQVHYSYALNILCCSHIRDVSCEAWSITSRRKGLAKEYRLAGRS